MAVAIHVLGPLTGQRGASGGGTDQEATSQLVSGGPQRVTGALEAEHRIEHVDRNHRHTVSGIRATHRGERGHRAGLVDSHVQDLALLALAVGQHQVVVDRGVVLAVWGVDLQRREQRIHPEGARLVRDDRHYMGGEPLVAHQILQQTHPGHGGGHRLIARALLCDFIGLGIRQ